ncbi:hypothetical protein PoB_000542300 [Plakobranchus ocellatus]|uniref:Uncharacterized protein n=1 Tax=Plakobranchus ocellatus TaxID=259542 RepID=A0AAV3Y8T3_9GAST|nr:hypothetical protein PoB_000542300 [Plakobranchus ocellatus]
MLGLPSSTHVQGWRQTAAQTPFRSVRTGHPTALWGSEENNRLGSAQQLLRLCYLHQTKMYRYHNSQKNAGGTMVTKRALASAGTSVAVPAVRTPGYHPGSGHFKCTKTKTRRIFFQFSHALKSDFVSHSLTPFM